MRANGHTDPVRTVVVAGGGLAGQRCAETLRREGYGGTIRLVCAEARPPYDRPPLSKEVLSGSVEEASLAYRPTAWYAEHEVELLLGVRADALWPCERRLELSSGKRLGY